MDSGFFWPVKTFNVYIEVEKYRLWIPYSLYNTRGVYLNNLVTSCLFGYLRNNILILFSVKH